MQRFCRDRKAGLAPLPMAKFENGSGPNRPNPCSPISAVRGRVPGTKHAQQPPQESASASRECIIRPAGSPPAAPSRHLFRHDKRLGDGPPTESV
jgi:hypothetical protein